jgi:purine-binding chemotaxis protein CheW
MKDNVDTEKENRYLVFQLNGKQFAMPLLEVREVIGNSPLTSVPCTPSYFKGIMNLRDTVISVIDLAEKFKIPKSEDSTERSIIILNHDAVSLGVIVDSISSVVSFQDDEMNISPKFESTVGKKYISAVGRKDNQLVLIIDVWSVLTSEDFSLLNKKTA